MAGSKKYSRKSDITLAVILLVLGLGSVALGIMLRVKAAERRNACTESATALVVRTEKKDGKHDKYRAVLLYSTKNGRIGNVTTPWTAEEYKDNETVEIRYDPEDPGHIYVDSHKPYSESGGVLMPFLGVSFIALSVLFFKGPKKKKPNAKKKEAVKVQRPKS